MQFYRHPETMKIFVCMNRGREGFRLPSLRTVQAVLPHTALQSVVSSSGLTDQYMGCGYCEQPMSGKISIWPSLMVSTPASSFFSPQGLGFAIC